MSRRSSGASTPTGSATTTAATPPTTGTSTPAAAPASTSAATGATPSAAAPPSTTGGMGSGQQPYQVTYVCGDCGMEVLMSQNDAIRCKGCGYRILYKKRTSKMIQFEAR
ncbi:DNA-directed RNA polymerases I, II, and III subunit RPABC4 [Pelomyxa schiedti]|nr:DNA-directed RNA polymerases I, II, and III subunit RPABC4 [Pelomyxa schiedti]